MYTQMKNISNWAKEIIWRMKGAWERRARVRWLLHSQRVQIWQSFAQGWPTQRHCAPVTAALQQQMKLSAGRRLYSDSRSTLSLQSVADKYVGFQSCQGRRWTVGQGAKRRAKAFPSPRNLFSMSLVTSRGTHSAWAIQRAPGPQISHTVCRGSSVSLPLPVTAITLSPPLSLFSLCSVLAWRAKNILHREKARLYQTVPSHLWQIVILSDEDDMTFPRHISLDGKIKFHHTGNREALVCILPCEWSWQAICGVRSSELCNAQTMTLFSSYLMKLKLIKHNTKEKHLFCFTV